MLQHKKVLLCVTGGIAVYKAVDLTSKLVQAGASVKVIMTPSAQKFVTPLAFQALSRNDVYIDTFDEKDPSVISHIDLADWADVIVVAPATANVIAKLANGIADDMVTTTLLATTAPVYIAPAMNVHMYEHAAVQANMKKLMTFHYQFIEPNEGFLACGYVGKGRLEEPLTIVEKLKEHFLDKEKLSSLQGKLVLVTAGPTVEKIDPVRFLTNHSTGKMGYAVAEAAANFGAEVILVSGPTTLPFPTNVKTIQVQSAEEMYKVVLSHYDRADIVIKSAAVADYRPKIVHSQKVKKQKGDISIEMERTKDILKTLGENKQHQILVGFAAETNDLETYARQKLTKKNLDFIVANNVTEKGAGFGADTNVVTILSKDGDVKKLPMLSKKEVAIEILKRITEK
ncbi:MULTISPECIES: bifunctional phosphopantothenoylcysteine decarboxylase/phosphopantothenate--cysteine ligase CoaBC [Bacillus]|uniref:bifunctional phosphopantothenoylcysteine decarboxylase/phosphopantothenate--cysteine ligase CoaBC n=1 Tax=Bacillus TaxID=1386 RepID=UPI000BB9872A|nr:MULTISPECIES: bifunctional phosphopantothenoylcysteine decarboxylase/phosphopantothenate--cysteine ligase CoaBC [Bacillus]